MQLSIAVQNYESTHLVFPPGVVDTVGPIVNTPTDAIRTFFSSGMDALVIGSYLVEK